MNRKSTKDLIQEEVGFKQEFKLPIYKTPSNIELTEKLRKRKPEFVFTRTLTEEQNKEKMKSRIDLSNYRHNSVLYNVGRYVKDDCYYRVLGSRKDVFNRLSISKWWKESDILGENYRCWYCEHLMSVVIQYKKQNIITSVSSAKALIKLQKEKENAKK